MHRTRELLLTLDADNSIVTLSVRFSLRGRKVMELFMHGCTYRQIAERLGISLSGVLRHREKMLWQNDCESMMELAARYQAALRAGQAEERKPERNR